MADPAPKSTNEVHQGFVTRHWRRIVLIGFAIIILAGAGFYGFLNTPAGTRFVQGQVDGLGEGTTTEISVGNIEGNLFGTPIFRDVVIELYQPIYDEGALEPRTDIRGPRTMRIEIDRMEADANLLLFATSSLPDQIIDGLDPRVVRLLGLSDRKPSTRLHLRLVDIQRGRMEIFPVGEVENEPELPLLPEMPISIDRLKVANFTVSGGIDGIENEPLALDARVALEDRRAVVVGSGTFGSDAFRVDLDSIPDDDIYDLDLALDAADGGALTGLLGLEGGYEARIKGDGSWDRWSGHALASRDETRIGAFRIEKRGDVFGLSGIADPTPFTSGTVSQALGDNVAIGVVARVRDLLVSNPQACGEAGMERIADGEACRLVNGSMAMRAAGLRVDGRGSLDLTNLRAQDFVVEGRLLDEDLFGESARIEGLAFEATLNGLLDELDIEHTIVADRIGAGAVELAGMRQEGRLAYRGGQFVLPLDVTVDRIVTGNELADPRLSDGTLRGTVAISGTSLSSDRLDISFPGAEARLRLDADLATQDIRLTGPAAINRVPIETVGIVNGGGTIDFAYRGNGTWTFDSDFDAAVPVVTNDTIANLAGPRLDIAGGVSLSSAGPITFRQVRLNSRQLVLTLDGRVEEGTTSVAGNGRHTEYGAFTVQAAITGRGPEAVLVFAEPLPAAGLKDVRVALSPTAEGFAIETQGQSMLGPFDGALTLVSPANGPTRISIERMTVSETEVSGELFLAEGGVDGRLQFADGGLDGTVVLAPRGGGQGFDVELVANNARFGGETPLVIAQGSLQGSGVFAGGIADPNTTATASMTGQGISYGSLFIGRMAATAELRNGMGDITASVTGRRDARFALQLNGQVSPDRIALAARGEFAGERISMPRRAVLTPTDDGWQLARTQLEFAGGTAQVEGEFGGSRTRVDLALDDMPLRLTDIFLADLGLGGTISGDVTYAAEAGGLPTGEARVKVDDLTRSGLVLASRPIDLSLVGRLTTDRLEARAVLDDEGGQRGRLQMRIANLPASGDLMARLYAGDLLGQLRYRGPAASLWRLAAIDAFDFTGPASVAADITGTLADPQLRGSLSSDGLRVQSSLSGTDIRDASVRGTFAGSRLRITRFAGTAANGGSITGSGFIDLAGMSGGRGPQIDLRAATRNARLLNARGLSATVTGPVRIVSDGIGGTIAGRLTVDRASWQFGVADEAVTLPNIPTREVNLPFDIAPPSAPGAPWRYLIDAVAPSRVDVDGMGLDSEWSADIRLRGTTDDPRIGGEARVVRGYYSFAGTRFELTRGRIEFDENEPIDPRIDVIAETEENGVNVEVSVQGNAQQPEISFSSTPALPEEEILARLLFGGSITDLSATDAVQLGAALASLRGGGGMDPINQLRSAIGLDRLRIVGADPATGRGTGVALGKNFGRRFYVELITDGRGYTATEVEFRVTSWLSLLAAVSSIGRESAVAEISRDY